VLLSEALLNGDFKITENFKDKLNNIVRRLLSTIGVRAKFDNNQDALNFVKDYNRSITKGKLTRGQKNTIKKGARGSMVTANVVNKGTQEIKTSKATPKSDLKESKTLTIEQLTEKAEDLLEQSNLDSSNESLLDRYYDAMDAIAEMEDAESSESNTVVEQKEKKQVTKDDTPQPPRKKKDRSTKRYTLTDEQKAEIEPLIAEAQVLNKELIAKEKAATAARIKKITDKSERQMSRTDQAKAIADIKANPTRFEKGAKLTNLENKIQEKIKVPLNKLINAYTKRLYDGIPAQAKEVVSREDYQMEARAVVVTTLINEFKKNTTNRLGEKTTNDIEDLMFNRGYFRMLPLATDMGVASKVQGIAQRFDNVSNNIGTEDIMFDEKNNEPEMTMEGKFKISSFLPADAYDLALEQTKEFWEKNVGNSPIENFKKLPSLVDDIMADIFGVSLNVFTARSGNLNTTSYNNVLQAITKPYAVLKLAKNGKTEEIRVELNQVDAYESQLKDEGIEFERYADENILQTLFKFLPKLSADDYVYADGSKGRYRGKATGIPKNLVALTYENITRGTTGVGNRKANVGKQAYKDILNAIGGTMVDGKVIKRIGITGKSKEGQTLLGVLKLYNRMVTNEISRSPAVNLDPMTVKDLAAGKNNLMESKKIDLSGINKLNPEVDFEFSKWYNSRKKSPSSAAQFKKLSNISYNILGDLGRKLFNAELVYNFDKLGTDASLESIRDSIGKAWGKSYKWLVRNQGFNKAIEKLNENSTNEDVKQFLQGFSRAWRNDKYQDISTNEQLVETIEDQGVDFEGLGFKFVKRGGKGFIYEIKANGAIEFVNDPTTLLEIKNKSFDYIEVYGKNSVKEVQTLQKVVLDIINAAETVDDKIAAIEAMSIGLGKIGLQDMGEHVVSIGLMLFAFSTIITYVKL
jgi:DNA-binding MarR family transcriptional regulator